MDREFESSFPVLTHDKIPMLNANLEPHITITVRHEQATAFLKEYATSKIEGLHLDYPKIIEAKAILDVQGKRHTAEILLFCANHITIDASSETEDMNKSIDETIDKIARRMRKHKTRLLKRHRPRARDAIRFLDEKIYALISSIPSSLRRSTTERSRSQARPARNPSGCPLSSRKRRSWNWN